MPRFADRTAIELWNDLLAGASDEELDMIARLAAKAGYLWRCHNCGYDNDLLFTWLDQTNQIRGYCEYCGCEKETLP